MTAILINDLDAHTKTLRRQIDAASKRVFDGAWYVMGLEVREFEFAFARYLGAEHCIGVANGTDALELCLRALGIKAGDKVALAANAGMYAFTAMQPIGATPHWIDVDPDSYTVTREGIKAAIKNGIRAVVVTHLFGFAVNEIEEIASDCKNAGVFLIEDCAQAHGARVNGRCVGSFGDVAAFSFYPSKNLGGLGDGGAVVCREIEVRDRAAALAQYGWTEKYHVTYPGARNSRLDTLQAAFLLEFLPLLDGWNERRRNIAYQYSKGLQHPQLIAVPSVETTQNTRYVAHLYVVRVLEREKLAKHLAKYGITSGIHYPLCDHQQPLLRDACKNTSLPFSEMLADQIFTLPCYPELTDEMVARVINTVNSWRI